MTRYYNLHSHSMEKYNPFAYFYYQLYLLQLEEYDITRFFKTIWATQGVPKARLRKKLVFTPKLILIAGISFAIIFGLSLWLSFLFLITFYVSFFPIIVSVFLLVPLDLTLKHLKIKQAKKVLDRYPKLKIIGIVGSFGKNIDRRQECERRAKDFIFHLHSFHFPFFTRTEQRIEFEFG